MLSGPNGGWNRRSFLKGTGAAAVAVSFGGSAALGQSQKLNVYNWDTYIGDTTLETFSKATGIDVQYDL